MTKEITTFKGFNQSLACRGFQFEIGKTYEQTGAIEACRNGFHACEHPLDVFQYYPPAQSRFCVVTQSGDLSGEKFDSKLASAKITICAEIHVHEMIQRAVAFVLDRAKKTGRKHTRKLSGAASATGYSGAASATGYSGAASATGECGAASATGTRGAASATGECGAASATGECGAASATGYSGRVKGAEGNALFLVYRPTWNGPIEHAWAGIAGRNGIKPDVWYTLNAEGKPVEVTP